MNTDYWDGVGIPPIGQRVVHFGYGGKQDVVEIIAHGFSKNPIDGSQVPIAIFQAEDGCGGGESKDFKRDPEQAENFEREKAVEEMLLLDPYDRMAPTGMMSRADFCRVLFDAGYKK